MPAIAISPHHYEPTIGNGDVLPSQLMSAQLLGVFHGLSSAGGAAEAERYFPLGEYSLILCRPKVPKSSWHSMAQSTLPGLRAFTSTEAAEYRAFLRNHSKKD